MKLSRILILLILLIFLLHQCQAKPKLIKNIEEKVLQPARNFFASFFKTAGTVAKAICGKACSEGKRGHIVHDYRKFIEQHMHDCDKESCPEDILNINENYVLQRPGYPTTPICEEESIPCEALKSAIEVINKDYVKKPHHEMKFLDMSRDPNRQTHLDNSTLEGIVCVSGLFSQKDNFKKQWGGVISTAEPHKPVFAFKWPSDNKFSAILNVWRELRPHKRILKLASESGKLLANALVLEYPEYLPSVTIVAFSLGTEVALSCLEELHRLGATNIINNVYLLGGATAIPENRHDIFDVINGRLIHVYTLSDWILIFSKFFFGRDQFGLKWLDEDLVKKIESDGVEVEQIEISEVANGHRRFRPNLLKLMEYIDFH
ncbi:unnamed protein product [Moneuplotes crassus]|uniref:Uncharacterized protein n=1 Tax=Euplotes crassus TaxID=5936 RepID=A0AAD1XNA4_EUPCR|nr:unnamed protein product [Moneuplotes crassus]